MRAFSMRLIVVHVVLLLVFGPTALAAGAAGSEPTQAEAAAHHAKGEAYYEGQWVPIPQLLKICTKAREAAKPDVERQDATSARVAEINKTLAEMLKEYRSKKAPLEEEMTQARAKRSAAARALSIPPPAKPNKIRLSRGKGNSSTRRQNREREQRYQRELQQYKELRSQATKALKEAEATIKRCDRDLEELYTVFKLNQKPLLTERTEVTQAMREAQQRIGVLRSKILRIAAALAEVPEETRIRFGAVEWQGEFYTLNELTRLHAAMTGEIEVERQRIAQNLAAEGKSLPKTWRHPKQQVADALKARIAGAEAERADAKKP